MTKLPLPKHPVLSDIAELLVFISQEWDITGSSNAFSVKVLMARQSKQKT